MYDYLEETIKNIEKVFADYDWKSTERKSLESEMVNTLVSDDAVTGIPSKSFTHDANLARKYVSENPDLFASAWDTMHIKDIVVFNHMAHNDWEWMDMVMRGYVLPCAVSEFLDRYTDKDEDTKDDSEGEPDCSLAYILRILKPVMATPVNITYCDEEEDK